MKAFVRALCGAAVFTVPNAGQTAAPLETDTMVGLMVKANPKLLDRKAVQSFATFVWCHEYGGLRNEFQREDYLNALADRMKALGANSLGRIEGLTRRFPFFEYDFKTETLQINRGQYDWARTAPVGNLLSPQNRPCWANPGNMFSFTPIVEALPDWNIIPYRLSIPKDQARALFEHGRPTAELTFSTKVETFTVEPMGSPKYIFRGPTTQWELVIYDGKGEEARRLSSDNRSAAAAPAPAANRATLSPGASRLTTADINVRAKPSLTGNLMATLGANTVIDIEEPSPDGQWTRITATPIVRGWANNAVILKSSVPNAPTAAAPPATTASLSAPKPDGESLTQKIMFLLTGLDGPPYREVEEFHNAHGTHIKTVAHTYEPTFESPCVVKLRYTSAVKRPAPSNAMDRDHTTSLRRFDFTRMTRITARYTTQPEEGLWWAFAGGPSNPRMRKPRLVNLIDYFGPDASCALKDDATPYSCSKHDQSNGNFPYPNPAKRPKHFQEAFKAIKGACRH